MRRTPLFVRQSALDRRLGLGGQQQKGLHLPAHPLILVVDDLFPDAHGKARDVNRDQAAVLDVLAHR